MTFDLPNPAYGSAKQLHGSHSSLSGAVENATSGSVSGLTSSTMNISESYKQSPPTKEKVNYYILFIYQLLFENSMFFY